MSDLPFILIIPAAGTGSRLGQEIPKPFLEIAGKTLLEHTVSCFATFHNLKQLIIATSESYFDKAKAVRDVIPAAVRVEVVKGGEERQDSVYNALQVADGSVELIAVHDAARPFVRPEMITVCLETAYRTGAAIVGIPVQDTIKKVSRGFRVEETPDRSFLWQAQTPQIFRSDLIRKAYDAAREDQYTGTDDASLVEHIGKEVAVVPGSGENFKVTYPRDLQLAALLLTSRE